MNKGIIIIGDAYTGKSLLAKQLVENYKKEEVALIDGRFFSSKSNFKYQNCTKDTKVIIIEDFILQNSFFEFLSIVSGSILVNKQSEAFFEINIEKLIVVCSDEIKETHLPTGESFLRRFEIINMNLKSNILKQKGCPECKSTNVVTWEPGHHQCRKCKTEFGN